MTQVGVYVADTALHKKGPQFNLAIGSEFQRIRLR